ncbi:EamA family transporter [Microbacteriaceae bacterium VKM Ac-2855]|nr:EamA family transporter [Microbacteriaceae bacterium VKM Ac-2855]
MNPAVLVLLAAICFATTGTAQALGAADVHPLTLGAARIVLGGAVLAGALGVERMRRRAPVARPRGSRRSAALLVVAGSLGVAGYQPTFFTGTGENGVAVGTIVALGSAPIFTGLLEWAVLRTPPGRRWAYSTALAAVGVVFLSGVFALGGAAEGVRVTPLGLLASAGAGLCYGVYAVCGKLLLERGWTPAATMGAQFGVAAAVMLPVLLLADPAQLASGPVLLTVLWLGVITVAVAYTLFARGLRMLPAAQVSTLTLAEPATATVLGVVVLHEVLTPDAVIGLVVLLVAVLVLTVRRRGAVLAE